MSVEDRIVEFLAPKRALLVLDNCEHVLEGAAALVQAVVAGTGRVDVLATSREPLGVPGEQRMPLGSAADPGGGRSGCAGADSLRRTGRRHAPGVPARRRRPRRRLRAVPPGGRAAPRHRAGRRSRRIPHRRRDRRGDRRAARGDHRGSRAGRNVTVRPTPSSTGPTTSSTRRTGRPSKSWRSSPAVGPLTPRPPSPATTRGPCSTGSTGSSTGPW